MFAALISTEDGNSIAVILLLLVIFKRAKVKRVNRKCSQMLENKQTKKKKPLKSNSIFLPALLIVKSIEQFPFVSNISSSFYHVLVLLLVIKRKKVPSVCPSYLLQNSLTNGKNYPTEECTKHSLHLFKEAKLVGWWWFQRSGMENSHVWIWTHILGSKCILFSMRNRLKFIVWMCFFSERFFTRCSFFLLLQL